MFSKSEICSVLDNLRVFKPFFPLKTIVRDLFVFPFEYYLNQGKALVLPTNLDLFLTHRCNLFCNVCFNQRSRKIFSEDLDFRLIERLVEAFPRNYCPAIFFGGGEPFIREDIIEIVKLIKRKGLKLGAVTNGLLLKENMSKELKNYPPDIMMFSFHGPRHIHEKIVGLAGSFDEVLANIKMFQRECPNSKVIFSYIFNEFNFSAAMIEEFVKQCLEKKVTLKNIRFVHLNFLTLKDQKKQREVWPDRFKHWPEPIYNIYEKTSPDFDVELADIERILSYLKKNKKYFSFSFKPFLSKREIISWYTDNFDLKGRKCLFPWRSLFINVDGKVYSCQNMHFPLGSIKENTLKEVWNSKESITFREELKKGLFPACARCCKL